MTLATPEGVLPTAARIPSVVVIGADALLAARPATAVQFAHACMQMGYENVVPASWGDELIAAATLRALESHGRAPAVQCSCPLVAERLLAAGGELRPFLVSLVSPPVAVARYLRALHAPAHLHITYVGGCPGAMDAAIDERLRPDELLARFIERGVVLEDEPVVFDSIIPPDRRRFRSQPGGLPAPDALWGEAAGRSIAQVGAQDLPVDLAQQLLSDAPVLVDIACALGCVCSGAVPGAQPFEARASVSALEPPRATGIVVEEHVPVLLEQPVPPVPRAARSVANNGSPPPGANGTGAAPDRSSMNAGPEPGDPPPARAAGAPNTEEAASESAAPNGAEPAASTALASDAVRTERPEAARQAARPALTAAPSPRRHAPTRGALHPASGGMPVARDNGGRQLPRTYVATRRRAPVRAAHDATGSTASALGGTLVARREAAAMPESIPAPHPVAERVVDLGVTRLSDVRGHEPAEPREAPIDNHSPGRVVLFAVLIAVIVLVSAAIGVLVGRWLAPR
ncbi:MAG TPA: hypothetical protein VJU87_00985 [Gemmatimonadaceae bacterium]|nr:hypothetical protein [Gemmatimonadaceae bacterium]